MVEEPAASAPGRSRKEVLRYVLGIGLGIVVLLLLVRKRGDLLASWHQVSQVDVGWLLAAILAEALSLWGYAYLQHRVLRVGGATIPMRVLTLLSLANDAIANTVPGEPAVSSAYRYRHYRRYGASSASAGWTIFTILLAQAIGMSLLLLLAVVVALAGGTGAAHTGATVAGLVITIASAAVLLRRDLVLRLASGLVRASRRVTGRSAGGIGERVESTLARMREIPLDARSAAGIVVIAAGVWLSDFACLLCGFAAVRAPIPWTGVLLAYGVAQIVGSLPIVPGGLGVVEGSLAVILVGYGAGRVPAVSAALVFRAVSFWLGIALGWLSVAVIARQARRAGDNAREEVPDRLLP